MNRFIINAVILAISAFTYLNAQAAMVDHRSVPPNQYVDVDPNVMIDLSVETPMGGAAYNDQPAVDCAGRDSNMGICYSASKEYLGYFDPNKCYTYNSTATPNRFEPSGATNTDHECSGKYSGNFMNWASMTAIDIFAWTMTGGNRVVDTSTTTVVQRKRKQNNDDWFPIKYLKSGTNVAPSTVTPFTDSTIYIYNTDFGIEFGTNPKPAWGSFNPDKGSFDLNVEVCNETEGVEDNCRPYGSNYKPEGMIQNNAYRMRFAAMSYLSDNSQSRNGGVLRANMKYVGPYRKAANGGLETNPNAEWSATTGILVTNPDSSDATASGVSNSGVINYINKFGINGYKSYDPAGELFYECINYFKNRGPTTEYYSSLTTAMKDTFPVITDWDDPIQHSCQSNYILGINDANPWLDKRLPGTDATSSSYSGHNWIGSDYSAPSNADPAINVVTLTNRVGELQGINGTVRNIGCVPGDCNMDSYDTKTIANLGKAFGTHPYGAKENSYYIAGLAYYANTYDIRSDYSGEQHIRTFMIDTQEYSNDPLTGEMNMLWLAGKYGGFEDSNNNGEPDLAVEWDEDGDGTPDNYVLATDPQKLIAGLSKAFTSISNRISAGSSAAIMANSSSSTSVIVQALYQPKFDNTTTGQQVRWVGMVHALFLDDQGNLREDSNGNHTLDSSDKVAEFYYDNSLARTRVKRYTTTDGITLTYVDTVDIPDLKVLWNTRDELAKLDNDHVDEQRDYTDQINTTDNTRYIFTWIDSDADGVVDSGETKAFTATAMSSYYRYFNVADSATAENVVNYVRGQEGISGYRSRTIDYDFDGTDEVWRQGDVVHSSPTMVGPPSANYDVRPGDTSYIDFMEKYKNRRQVVYVGGNDGLLHAFNGGFFDGAQKKFTKKSSATATETEQPFGAELWAYAPMNLLPHMQWLKELDYPHIYYVDGPAKAYDVNIFANDTTHPNGWGTILVVGMRFGGNSIDVDTDGNATTDWTTRSAYIVLDITDPESPPTLIAEISDPNLGFTTSVPALSVHRAPGTGVDWTNPSRNEWTLVFGSGPNDLAKATSNRTARLYMYDLVLDPSGNPGGFITNFAPKDLTFSNSFVGNVTSKDWQRDLYDDIVYFGVAGGTISAPNGRLMRMVPGSSTMSGSTVSTLINPGQPFVGTPAVSGDEQGNWWVYAGTGRLFVRDDVLSTTTQSFYGLKDPVSANLAATPMLDKTDDLVETTDIIVNTDGTIVDPAPAVLDPPTISTFTGLVQRVADNEGWYIDFPNPDPSTRSMSTPAFLRTLLIFTSYSPPADICDAEGTSDLYVTYYKTGTAYPGYGLGDGGTGVTKTHISLGTGQATDPKVQGDGVISGNSTGGLSRIKTPPPPTPSGRQSWREIPLE